jgi:hypothetical protein
LMQPARPQHRGWLGKIGQVAKTMGNVAGDVFAPSVMAMIPGTDLNKRIEAARVEAQRERAQREGLEERRVGTEERRVGVEEAKEKREAEAAGQPKPKEEEWMLSKDYQGPNGEPVEIEKNSGALRLAGSGISGIKRIEPGEKGKPSEEDKAISDYLAANKLTDTPANRDKARDVLKTRDRKPVDEELTDINKQIKEAQLEKLEEPTVDETRRADLARNMRENLESLEEIATRRPDLFGPLAGRLTTLRQAVGTDDPDVAKLRAIHEYLGMASVGAHAMRNAQHVGAAADAIMASFTNSPKAMLAAIEEGKKSTQTFLDDEQRRGNKAMERKAAKEGTAEGGETVNVIAPNGTPGTIPKKNLAKAKKKGYKEAQ